MDRGLYICTSDFLRISGYSLRTLNRIIRRGALTPIKKEGKNWFIYTDLPRIADQEAFIKERGVLSGLKEDIGNRKIYNLKPWQKEEADKREAIVKEYLAVSKDVPPKKRTKFKRKFAKSKGIGYRTLDNHISLFKEGGYYALVPDWKNGAREKLLNAEIVKFIEQSYLIEYGPPLKKVWEDSVRLLGGKYPKHPSYRTFAHYVQKKWTTAQQLLIRDPEAWNRKYSPYVRRNWNDAEVNEVWIGDGKQVDVACLYRGKPIFPWISMFLDARSRKFVGWIVTPTHNSLAIGQAFSYAARQCGPPKTVYIDRGKDYKSKLIAGEKIKKGPTFRLFGDVDQTIIPGILRELGVEIFFAAPYNPREKIIEPNFGIFTDRLRHLPGYRGHNTKTRPKKLTQEIKTGSLLSFEELALYLDKFIEERNDRPHSTTQKTPNSFYENFIPHIPSQEVLDFLLMDVKQVKVRDSSVIIDGLLYRGEELWRLAGEKVEVRRDPKDITRAVIIYKGEPFGPAYLEMTDHYRGPITLETRKTCVRLRRKTRKFREEVYKAQDTIDDPLRMEIEVEEKNNLQKRDIRPAPNPKVISLHKKEHLARKVSKVLSQPDPESLEEIRVAAGGGKDIYERLAATYQPIIKEKTVPMPRYIRQLSYKEAEEDAF